MSLKWQVSCALAGAAAGAALGLATVAVKLSPALLQTVLPGCMNKPFACIPWQPVMHVGLGMSLPGVKY